MPLPGNALPPMLALLGQADGPWSGLVASLRSLGASVEVACDADAAPARATALALVDLAHPNASKEGPAQLVRRMARGGEVAVIALAAGVDPDPIVSAHAGGATDFLTDPRDLEHALVRIRFALADRPLRPADAAASERDRLTGLPTRSAFLRDVEVALHRARSAASHVALLCIDVDRLRQVAGPLSLQEEDELVFAVASRLRDGVRERDSVVRAADPDDCGRVARIGGEQFTLLVEGLLQIEDAARVARRMVDLMTRPFTVGDGHEVYLTVNVGIAVYPSEAAGAEQLLKCAETAALSAKQSGQNAVQFFSPVMNARAFERMTLESSLRHAIERGELTVHYQPRVSIESGTTVGLEALVRWNHPHFGLVSPGSFIPLAEETGLILPLGEFVLERACEDARRWQERGFDPVKLSVNVSPVQLRERDLFSVVLRTLARAGLDSHWLELEVTETSLMQDYEAVTDTLRRFKDIGIGVSIDDFGTGWSSLAHLRKLPIDALKIDRSFLRDVTSSQDDASIVTAILLMGKSLRLRVIAEGVETPGQLAFLRIMRCDEAQGFLFSPAVPADAVERFLSRGEGAAHHAA